MKETKSILNRLFSNRVSLLLVVLNLVATIWIYFYKPRVPGFRYDYFEEPYYYWVFKTLNLIPDLVTGLLFYPVFQIWSSPEIMRILGPVFHFVVLLLSSLQWALIGYGVSSLISRGRSRS